MNKIKLVLKFRATILIKRLIFLTIFFATSNKLCDYYKKQKRKIISTTGKTWNLNIGLKRLLLFQWANVNDNRSLICEHFQKMLEEMFNNKGIVWQTDYEFLCCWPWIIIMNGSINLESISSQFYLNVSALDVIIVSLPNILTNWPELTATWKSDNTRKYRLHWYDVRCRIESDIEMYWSSTFSLNISWVDQDFSFFLCFPSSSSF